MRRIARRRLLEGGAGLAALLAGCFGGGGGSDGTTTDGTTTDGTRTDGTTTDGTRTDGTTTAATTTTTTTGFGDGPLYVTWTPAPSAVTSGGHYLVRYLDRTTVREYADALPERVTNPTDSPAGRFTSGMGVAPGSIDATLRTTTGLVVAVGSFDPDALASELRDAGFEKRATSRGIRLFVNGPETVGVGESTLLTARAAAGDRSPTATARSAIDAAAGEADRYVDASDDYATALDPIGDVDALRAGTAPPRQATDPENGQFAGSVAVAAGWTIGPSTTEATLALVFQRADQTTPDAVRTWLTSGDQFAEYGDPSVQVEGRTVVASASVPTGEFDLLTGEQRDDRTPQVSFDFEYDRSAGTVTVSHQGGDSLTDENTGSLSVRVGDRSVEWSLPVSAGDQQTVEVSGGDTVLVVWTPPGGGESQILGEFEVPE